MSASAPPAAAAAVPTPRRQGTAALTLAALGVVYGDIGTSPLYTVKEIFAPGTGVPLDAAHLVGAVSAIFWALMFVVTLKYVTLILRADNRGEGGGLALTALAAQAVAGRPRPLALGLLAPETREADRLSGRPRRSSVAGGVLVSAEGIEPPTCGFEGRRSIHLSYGRVRRADPRHVEKMG